MLKYLFCELDVFLSCPQITEVQVIVTESSTALKEATSEMTETRRRVQSLEIELQSVLGLVRTQNFNVSRGVRMSDLSLYQPNNA